MYVPDDHAFALCAYEKSLFLEECIESLLSQTIRTAVIVCTSTPNDYLEELADFYSVPLYVRDGEPNIADDWNFAVDCALGGEEKRLVTIAHQDDVYLPTYTESMLYDVNSSNCPLIFFSDYAELRDGEVVDENSLLRVKRLMLSPLRLRSLANSRFTRRRILSLGSAICCPSVTLCLDNIDIPVFQKGMRTNLDWQAWERISRKSGSFVYDPEILMFHRIHGESETSKSLQDDTRKNEDLAMYERFWPKPIAAFINELYGEGRASNDL